MVGWLGFSSPNVFWPLRGTSACSSTIYRSVVVWSFWSGGGRWAGRTSPIPKLSGHQRGTSAHTRPPYTELSESQPVCRHQDIALIDVVPFHWNELFCSSSIVLSSLNQILSYQKGEPLLPLQLQLPHCSSSSVGHPLFLSFFLVLFYFLFFCHPTQWVVIQPSPKNETRHCQILSPLPSRFPCAACPIVTMQSLEMVVLPHFPPQDQFPASSVTYTVFV